MATENKIDFQKLGSNLLGQAQTLVSQWLPGGKLIGNEYCCGDLTGGAGQSLKINVATGKWADFASNEKGGDLISLYAAMKSLNQGQAARELSELYSNTSNQLHAPRAKPRIKQPVIKPPANKIPPDNFKHKIHGIASKVWTYRNKAGEPLFYVARYDQENNKKEIVPWTWNGSRWVNQAWPEPRPLYGLNLLRDGKPVLIVEGEKAADAARELAYPHYDIITWPNGGKSFEKVDWTPLYGKKILFWPDADEPGIQVVTGYYTPQNEYKRGICEILKPHCPEIKWIDVSLMILNQPGWDAADAMNSSNPFDWETFKTWAKSRVKVYQRPNPPRELIHIQPVERIEMPEPPEWLKDDSPMENLENALNFIEFGPLTNTQRELITRDGLSVTGTGSPQCNADNVTRIFLRNPDYKDLIWFDTFHNKLFIDPKSPREWSDGDSINIMIEIQKNYGMHKISETAVHQAAMFIGNKNKRNEPKDWMESLKWDQKPRIDNFLVDHMGCPDNSEYARAVSKNMFIAMAARVFKPGCKFDNMVVLEGFQGKMKSTSLDVLAGSLFGEAEGDVGSKDFALCLQGRLIVEVAELDAFSKADTKTIKKVCSRRIDRFRPPYGRNVQSFPRQGIMIGTTNDDEYLEDPTGGRRFWPVKTSTINLGLIRDDREQLFAEAVVRFKAGENWWLVPEDEAKEQQALRQHTDIWFDVIQSYISNNSKQQVTIRELATAEACLNISIDRLDKRVSNRIGAALRRLGWKAGKPERLNGALVKIFRPENFVTNYVLPTHVFEVSSKNTQESVEKTELENSKKKKIFNHATGNFEDFDLVT